MSEVENSVLNVYDKAGNIIEEYNSKDDDIEQIIRDNADSEWEMNNYTFEVFNN